jgi:hypothetical protein
MDRIKTASYQCEDERVHHQSAANSQAIIHLRLFTNWSCQEQRVKVSKGIFLDMSSRLIKIQVQIPQIEKTDIHYRL